MLIFKKRKDLRGNCEEMQGFHQKEVQTRSVLTLKEQRNDTKLRR